MINIILVIGSVVLLILIGIYFYYFEKFRKLLILKYRDDYEMLGKPSLVMNSSISNNFSFQKYLSSEEYKKHGDSQLNGICKIAFVILKIGHLLVGGVLLLFIFNALQII